MRPRTLVLCLLPYLLMAASTARAGGAITSGQTVAGTLSSPLYSESWTFSGSAGNRVLITAVTTSGSANTQITLKAPGGGVETTTPNDRVDWQLLANGTYTIVITDATLSNAGTYKTTFLNLASATLTSAGDLDGGPIASADIKSGSIGIPGDLDAFQFTGTTGDRILIAAPETGGANFNTTFYLYPPGGGPYLTWGYANRMDVQLTATGTWTVVMQEYGLVNTGTYSLSLLNVTAGPLTSGADPDGGTIASGESKTGTISAGGDFDAFRFTGTAGHRVLITGISTSGALNSSIAVYPPNGGPAELYTAAHRGDIQLAASGQYTIVIEDNTDLNSGGYGLALLDISSSALTSAGDLDGGPIASSDIKTGSIGFPGDLDAFQFTGTTGDRILIAAPETGGASFNTTFYLYPPGGGPFLTWGYSNRMDVQLTATGTWTVVMQEYGLVNTGTYALSLLNVTAGPLTSGTDPDGGAIASGESKTGTISAGGDFDAFRFTGTAGHRVLITGVSTSGALNSNIAVYPPNGGPAELYTAADRGDIQLAASGQYTIVIEDNIDLNSGGYGLALLDVTSSSLTSAGDLDGGPIASSDIKTGSIGFPGDLDAFQFTGTTGDRILIAAPETGGASFNTTYYLYPPGGGPYLSWGYANRMDVQLTATGTWTVVMQEYGLVNTGTYALSLLNVTAGPLTSGTDPDGGIVASGESKTGTTSANGDFDAFRFTGAINDRVLISAVTTSGALNTNIAVYPPNGGAAELYTAADRGDIKLAASGTYTVVIEDNLDLNSGGYGLTLLDITSGPLGFAGDMDGGAIASADVKTGTINVPGDMDAFQFTGTVGDRILFAGSALGSPAFNTTMYLYPPLGGAWATWNYADRTDFQLTATGTWTVVMQDYGLVYTGNYSLSLLNVTAGPLTSGPDPDGGAMNSGELRTGQMNQKCDFDAYRFSGHAGDRVLVSCVTTAGAMNSNVSIYPPGGGPAEAATTADRADLKLALTGQYTIVVEDAIDDTTGAYALGLLDLTSGPLVSASDPDGGAIASNDVKFGTMSGPADLDAFQFSGNLGDRVVLNGVATSGASFNTTMYLYPPGGGALATWGYSDRLDFQLTASGMWTVVVQDYSLVYAGGYNLAFLNVTSGPLKSAADAEGGTIIPGTPANGLINLAADLDGFHFYGRPGDTARVSCTVTSGAWDTQVSLYPPKGNAALSVTTADNFSQVLADTGYYTLVVSDNTGVLSGGYHLTLAGPHVVGVGDGARSPAEPWIQLFAPAPNPSRGMSRVSFRLGEAARIRLAVYGASGARIRTLADGLLAADTYQVPWDGRDDAGNPACSGVYFVRLESGRESRQSRLIRVH